MPHSTERGGDLTTLGARGWTHRTLEEVHDVVDPGLGVEEDVGEGRASTRAEEVAEVAPGGFEVGGAVLLSVGTE